MVTGLNCVGSNKSRQATKQSIKEGKCICPVCGQKVKAVLVGKVMKVSTHLIK